jgi:hypothetical protein
MQQLEAGAEAEDKAEAGAEAVATAEAGAEAGAETGAEAVATAEAATTAASKPGSMASQQLSKAPIHMFTRISDLGIFLNTVLERKQELLRKVQKQEKQLRQQGRIVSEKHAAIKSLNSLKHTLQDTLRAVRDKTVDEDTLRENVGDILLEARVHMDPWLDFQGQLSQRGGSKTVGKTAEAHAEELGKALGKKMRAVWDIVRNLKKNIWNAELNSGDYETRSQDHAMSIKDPDERRQALLHAAEADREYRKPGPSSVLKPSVPKQKPRAGPAAAAGAAGAAGAGAAGAGAGPAAAAGAAGAGSGARPAAAGAAGAGAAGAAGAGSGAAATDVTETIAAVLAQLESISDLNESATQEQIESFQSALTDRALNAKIFNVLLTARVSHNQQSLLAIEALKSAHDARLMEYAFIKTLEIIMPTSRTGSARTGGVVRSSTLASHSSVVHDMLVTDVLEG